MMTERAHKVEPRPELHPEAWEYSDGSVRRPGAHGAGAVYVTQPPWSAPTITPERSQELHRRKAEIKAAQQDDFKAEVQRALVSQVASDGTLPLRKTAGGEVAGWVGNLGAEMRHKSAPKEHGIRNYQAVIREVAITAGLIEEKTATHDNRSVNIESITLAPDVKEHVAMLLAKLASE